jgi:hypothetical protein
VGKGFITKRREREIEKNRIGMIVNEDLTGDPQE